MAFSSNRSDDLAALSDAELAQRLEEAWNVYEAAQQKRNRWWFPGRRAIRGPIHHPGAYRFFYALERTGLGPLELLFAAVLSDKQAGRLFRRFFPQNNMNLTLCEILDIVDEVKRRVAQRQGQTQ
jgi:hypothetical protein